MWKETEFIEMLESKDIDTVCFMGSGYSFEDIKVGSVFYISYAFMNMCGKDHNNIDNACIFFKHYYREYIKDHNLTDSYKIISKFKRDRHYKNKYQLVEYLRIKNLRTKEYIKFSLQQIDNMYLLVFDTID